MHHKRQRLPMSHKKPQVVIQYEYPPLPDVISGDQGSGQGVVSFK